MLAEMGHEVYGVDFSPGMVAVAKSLLGRSGLERQAARVSEGDPLRGLDFPSRWFDLVIASHVLHGMRAASRLRFYREARRVSRGPVLFFDYSPRELRGPRIIARVLEVLERSDYRRFRRGGVREMRELFTTVELLPASTGSAWYLCRAAQTVGAASSSSALSYNAIASRTVKPRGAR